MRRWLSPRMGFLGSPCPSGVVDNRLQTGRDGRGGVQARPRAGGSRAAYLTAESASRPARARRAAELLPSHCRQIQVFGGRMYERKVMIALCVDRERGEAFHARQTPPSRRKPTPLPRSRHDVGVLQAQMRCLQPSTIHQGRSENDKGWRSLPEERESRRTGERIVAHRGSSASGGFLFLSQRDCRGTSEGVGCDLL